MLSAPMTLDARAIGARTRFGVPADWRPVRGTPSGAAYMSGDGLFALTVTSSRRRVLARSPDAAAGRWVDRMVADAPATMRYRSGREHILYFGAPPIAGASGTRRWVVIGALSAGRTRFPAIGALDVTLAWTDAAPTGAVAAAIAAFEDEVHAVVLGEGQGAPLMPGDVVSETEPLTDFHRLRSRRFFGAIEMSVPARLEVERTASGRLRLFDRKGGPCAVYVDCDVERLPNGVTRTDSRRAARAVVAGALRNARARGGAVIRDDGAPQTRAIEEIRNAFHLRAIWDGQRNGADDGHRMFGWCVVKPLRDRLIIASFTLAIPLNRLGQPEYDDLVDIIADQIRRCGLSSPRSAPAPPATARMPEPFREPLRQAQAALAGKPFRFDELQAIDAFDGALSFRAPARWRLRALRAGVALYEPDVESGALQIAFRPRLSRLFGGARMHETVMRRAHVLRLEDIRADHQDAPKFKAASEDLPDGMLTHYAYDEIEPIRPSRVFAWSRLRRGRRALSVAEFVLSIPHFIADDEEMATLPVLIDAEIRDAAFNID